VAEGHGHPLVKTKTIVGTSCLVLHNYLHFDELEWANDEKGK
jgi:hypothetical protein